MVSKDVEKHSRVIELLNFSNLDSNLKDDFYKKNLNILKTICKILLEGSYYDSNFIFEIGTTVSFSNYSLSTDSSQFGKNKYKIYDNFKDIIIKFNDFCILRKNNLEKKLLTDSDFNNKNIALDKSPELYEINVTWEFNQFEKEIENSLLKNWIKLVYYNIYIAEIDESLTCNDFQVTKLLSLKEIFKNIQVSFNSDDFNRTDFSNFNPKSYNKITSDKIDFLIFKIEARRAVTINNSLPIEFKPVQLESPIIEDNVFENPAINYFELFKTKLKKHYRGEGSIFFKKDDINPTTILAESRNLRIKQTSTVALLNDIQSKISNIRVDEISFDSFSDISAKNLLFNTFILLKLENERKSNFKNSIENINSNSRLVIIEDVLKSIDENQIENKYYDYYPYRKLIQFIKDLIDYIKEKTDNCIGEQKLLDLQKNESEVKFSIDLLYDQLHGFLEKSLQFEQKNIKWFKERTLNPVYLRKEECLIGIEGVDDLRELFLDSSYIIPINFDEADAVSFATFQYKEITLKSLKNTLYQEAHTIFTEKDLKEKAKDIDARIKEAEIKSIQVLAMFITLATWVLANVKIFENRSLAGSISIMLAFTASLIAFVALIRWMSNDHIIKLRYGPKPKGESYISSFDIFLIVFFIVLILTSLTFGSLGSFKENKDINHLNVKMKENIDHKVDSIFKENQYRFLHHSEKNRLDKMEKDIKVLQKTN